MQGELTTWLAQGGPEHASAMTFPPAGTASAHRAVEAGAKLGAVVVEI